MKRESIIVPELEEFVSYLFTVTIETIVGVNQPEDTPPAIEEITAEAGIIANLLIINNFTRASPIHSNYIPTRVPPIHSNYIPTRAPSINSNYIPTCTRAPPIHSNYIPTRPPPIHSNYIPTSVHPLVKYTATRAPPINTCIINLYNYSAHSDPPTHNN